MKLFFLFGHFINKFQPCPLRYSLVLAYKLGKRVVFGWGREWGNSVLSVIFGGTESFREGGAFLRPSHAALIWAFSLSVRGGRVVQRCWVNFQCRGVLLTWITVGQGLIVLAVGAGGGCLDIFSLIYQFSFLSPSLWETARYRLKYCLKGPLSPKQPTNQPCLFLLCVM